ncbi:hypothetical protein [Streptomyces sp. NPDC050560]|uniref:hypothetical protein n=1 Tax=Streptomyces sp. NPDC050560 TaxID=3365630 RepID=UPI0037AB96BC
MSAGAAARAEHEALVRTLRGAWPSLPALAVATAAVCAAAAAVLVLTPGPSPLAPPLAALLVGPFAAALAATVNGITFEGEATVRQWAAALRRSGAFGARQALVAAAPAAVLLVCLQIRQQTGAAWVVPSLATSCALTAVALPALPVVLPLGTARPGLRGTALWTTALHLVSRAPVRFLAAPALAALGLWSCVTWTASLLPLAVGPAALVAGAAVWTTAAGVAPAAAGARHGKPGGSGAGGRG